MHKIITNQQLKCQKIYNRDHFGHYNEPMRFFGYVIPIGLSILLLSAMPCYADSPLSMDDNTLTKDDYGDAHIIDYANEAFYKRDFAQARSKCLQLLDSRLTNQAKARLYVNLSVCDAQLEHWQEASKESQQGLELAVKDSVAEDDGSLTEMDGLLVLARYLIVEKKISKAQEAYEQALMIARKRLGDWNCDLAPMYEGLAACDLAANNLRDTEAFYTKVAKLDYLKYGPDSTELAWSLLSLTNVLRSEEKQELADRLYKKVFWNFRHQNEERIISELQIKNPENNPLVTELRAQLYGLRNGYKNREYGLDFIRESIPENVIAKPVSREHDFNNWFAERVGRETAPGLAFFDPRTKLKALIVTVHGLGLHHSAYTPFSERVQHEGFGIINFDVRGFGSYRNDQVYQKVDFKAIISDLQRILSELRNDYPGMPIFILGESMGGAIALRLAAVSPDLVDGAVSSVPSGSRFHANITSLEVALQFLKGSHKQFNIGERVVAQATQDPQLRMDWEDDPSSRMNFSPVELIGFQKFMDDNLKYAAQIKCTPVIIFQGYCDQLVKPLSTLTLYQAITAKDKDLVFVGHAEHLIFEQKQFDQDVVAGLIGWLNRHIANHSEALLPAASNVGNTF